MSEETVLCRFTKPGFSEPGEHGGASNERFVFVPFDNSSSPIEVTPVARTSTIKLPNRPDQPIIDKGEYTRMVSEAVDHIRSNDLSKVVLARNKVVDLPANFDPGRFFEKLCGQYTHAFRYLFFHPDSGMWIGASPELLFSHEGNRFKTVALAGTLTDPNQEWTSKEYEEQEIVTRFISKKLTSAGATELKIGKQDTVSAATVRHLRTQISGSMGTSKPEELYTALHPTPAVAGYPRAESIDYINQHEGLNRSFYSGYFGLVSPEKSLLHVNLRCMRIYQNAIEFFAGAGITRDSDPLKEWEETERKIDTLLSLL